MDYNEYKSLRSQITAEYERELEALDRVWKRLQALKSPSTKLPLGQNGEAPARAPIIESIRTAIKGFKQDFTANDVQQALIDHGFITANSVNRLSITNALHR